MRETIPVTQAGRAKRETERLTGTQRMLLEAMRDHGPYTPASLPKASAMDSLVERGFAEEMVNLPGSFKLLPKGSDRLNLRGGRPSKVEDTPLQPLVDYCGGLKALSDRIGVAPNTLTRWAVHGTIPRSAGRKNLIDLAKEAGCDISPILKRARS